MNRPAMLRATICTPWGYYAPGMQVSAVRIEGPTVTICLDNNHHTGRRLPLRTSTAHRRSPSHTTDNPRRHKWQRMAGANTPKS